MNWVDLQLAKLNLPWLSINLVLQWLPHPQKHLWWMTQSWVTLVLDTIPPHRVTVWMQTMTHALNWMNCRATSQSWIIWWCAKHKCSNFVYKKCTRPKLGGVAGQLLQKHCHLCNMQLAIHPVTSITHVVPVYPVSSIVLENAQVVSIEHLNQPPKVTSPSTLRVTIKKWHYYYHAVILGVQIVYYVL